MDPKTCIDSKERERESQNTQKTGNDVEREEEREVRERERERRRRHRITYIMCSVHDQCKIKLFLDRQFLAYQDLLKPGHRVTERRGSGGAVPLNRVYQWNQSA